MLRLCWLLAAGQGAELSPRSDRIPPGVTGAWELGSEVLVASEVLERVWAPSELSRRNSRRRRRSTPSRRRPLRTRSACCSAGERSARIVMSIKFTPSERHPIESNLTVSIFRSQSDHCVYNVRSLESGPTTAAVRSSRRSRRRSSAAPTPTSAPRSLSSWRWRSRTSRACHGRLLLVIA